MTNELHKQRNTGLENQASTQLGLLHTDFLGLRWASSSLFSPLTKYFCTSKHFWKPLFFFFHPHDRFSHLFSNPIGKPEPGKPSAAKTAENRAEDRNSARARYLSWSRWTEPQIRRSRLSRCRRPTLCTARTRPRPWRPLSESPAWCEGQRPKSGRWTERTASNWNPPHSFK